MIEGQWDRANGTKATTPFNGEAHMLAEAAVDSRRRRFDLAKFLTRAILTTQCRSNLAFQRLRDCIPIGSTREALRGTGRWTRRVTIPKLA